MFQNKIKSIYYSEIHGLNDNFIIMRGSDFIAYVANEGMLSVGSENISRGRLSPLHHIFLKGRKVLFFS